MNQIVDPTRLKQLRHVRGELSQDELAKKAGVNKQTVYRLEKERRSIRQGTLVRLSRALDVEPDVLTGEKPLPNTDQSLGEPVDESTYQLKAPLDASTRNAFSLAAMRYKIPVSRIVELAPFLFVLAAEGSLNRRLERVGELEKALDSISDLNSKFPHLPAHITFARGDAEDAIQAEKASIAACDIFAEKIPNDIYWDGETYDSDTENPFATYLKALAASTNGVANIDALDSRSFTSYQVCRDRAVKLAGGDESLADEIMNGWVVIHKMPRELLGEEATPARVEWIRSTIAPILKAREDFQKLSAEDQPKSLGL
jgi:transcriptional regulator with XRE-family HTH domain